MLNIKEEFWEISSKQDATPRSEIQKFDSQISKKLCFCNENATIRNKSFLESFLSRGTQILV